MLQKLYIRNYAIIDELTLDFDPHLNVITGETGAGKSIILGALSLILGERADTSVLIDREEKSVVEAHFHTTQHSYFNNLLDREGLDREAVTIIRREISASGKSRAFVNDTPVNLGQLHELTSALVDLHRQFDNHALDQQAFTFEVMDAVADNQELLAQYRSGFLEYRRQQAAFRALSESQEQWRKEADYKQFLFDELEQAAFAEDEIEESGQLLRQLGHAEQIRSVLQQVYLGLEEGEQPLNNELKRLYQQLQTITQVQPETEALADRMNSALLELRDIAGELDSLQQKVDLDPEKLQRMQERTDLGYRLLKKHGLTSTAELRDLQQRLSGELSLGNNAGERLETMAQEIEGMTQALRQQAAVLGQRRRQHSEPFAAQVNALLALVGMPNAELRIDINDSGSLQEYGADHITFLWDANKSGKFQPVQKTASGGELSRIMLCIKALTAKALALPTLIFDEVDAGISGEAARQVGILLQSLGAVHQVLCITHQPQVAAKGRQHFYVYKTAETNGKVKTRVRLLSAEEKIKAIAQMIGGAQPSEAAMENARELVG